MTRCGKGVDLDYDELALRHSLASFDKLRIRSESFEGSQRMLNALEPGTPLPIHRHRKSTETVVCLRGHLREVFYNDAGEVTEVIDLAPNSVCVAINISLGQWHSVEVLESGIPVDGQRAWDEPCGC